MEQPPAEQPAAGQPGGGETPAPEQPTPGATPPRQPADLPPPPPPPQPAAPQFQPPPPGAAWPGGYQQPPPQWQGYQQPPPQYPGGPGWPPAQQFPGAPGGYGVVAPPNDAMAVWSLVIAILGFFCCGVIGGPVAFFLGQSSLGRIRRSNGALGGEGLANAGRIIGAVETALWILGGILWLVVAVTSRNGG